MTSVWGMLFSLLFNYIEKHRIGRVSRAIADLQRALDQLFTLTTQEEISFRQEDELAQQTAALKSFSTDLANEVKSAMEPGRREIIQELQGLRATFSNALTMELIPRLEKLHVAATESHKQGTRERQEIIQEIQGLPSAFSNAMEPSLDKLNKAVEKLRKQKEESSTDAIQKLVEEFQKFLSGSIMKQMGTLAETLGKVSESLITLPKQMEQMIADVQKQIDQTCRLLDATSEEQVKRMQEMFGEMNEVMRKMVADVHNLVESVADKMETVSAQTIRTLQGAIAQLQSALDSTASQTSAEFEQMTNRIRKLIDHSATRLDDIFTDGEQSVSTLLQQQGEQTEAINAQLNNWQDTLTGGREMLKQMNTSVASVHQLIETTEALSGQLTTSATQLESAGRQLTQASNAFNQENARYLTANRETTRQIQAALDESQQLLGNFTQRFQTIDNGLTGIFEEIERGLTNYTTASRDSINTYLNDFSRQLTQASTALAGSVEALGENVEILIDMIERRPRR